MSMPNSNSTYNLKKTVLLIFITVLITLINISGYTQEKIFALQNEAEQRVKTNYTFTGDTLINRCIILQPRLIGIYS